MQVGNTSLMCRSVTPRCDAGTAVFSSWCRVSSLLLVVPGLLHLVVMPGMLHLVVMPGYLSAPRGAGIPLCSPWCRDCYTPLMPGLLHTERRVSSPRCFTYKQEREKGVIASLCPKERKGVIASLCPKEKRRKEAEIALKTPREEEKRG